MSTSAKTVVDLDEPTEAWRWQCPRKHANWIVAEDCVYCRTCNRRGYGAAHTKLWDACEKREVPIDELEIVADEKEWRL